MVVRDLLVLVGVISLKYVFEYIRDVLWHLLSHIDRKMWRSFSAKALVRRYWACRRISVDQACNHDPISQRSIKRSLDSAPVLGTKERILVRKRQDPRDLSSPDPVHARTREAKNAENLLLWLSSSSAAAQLCVF